MFALLGLLQLARPPVVALSERGVHLRRGSGQSWIPWDEVEYVGISKINRAPFLGVDGVNGPRREGRSFGSLTSWARGTGADISIPLDVVGVDPDELERLVNELVAEPAARSGIAERGGRSLATPPERSAARRSPAPETSR